MSSPPTSRGDRFRRWRRRGSAAFVPALAGFAALWAIGQWQRDRFWLTGLCFYIPSPCAALFPLLGAAGLTLFKRRRAALAALALAAAPLWFAVKVESRFDAAAPHTGPTEAAPAGTLRLVAWNIFFARLGEEEVAAELAAQRADIYLLAEVPLRMDVDGLARCLGEGYQALRMGDMAAIARGRLSSEGWRLHKGDIRQHALSWERGGARLRIHAVDLPANPLVHRHPILQEVLAVIERDRPDLVAGDFNAPRRSLALDALPEGYCHAYDRAGSGWSYTWPAPLPLYAIDQCIAGERVEVLSYRLRSTLASDHRMQILEFRLVE
jgi:endonuclease/exonuclease/phosphatase (EEP) superfamily protein YafD